MAVTKQDLIVTSSPHVRSSESVPRIMHTVWLALLPACVAAAWVFGIDALVVIGLTTVACVVFEALFLKMRGQSWKDIRFTALDGSAIVTGVLLALNLPASSPWWMMVIGAFVAMALGKHLFGGLGNNPFNPAMLARVFLLVSFPTQMLSWSAPVDGFTQTTEQRIELDKQALDGQTYATPLGKMKEAARAYAKAQAAAANPAEGEDPAALKARAEELKAVRADVDQQYPMLSMFLGNVGGSLGEVSGLALLLGALILFIRRCITWHIPLTFILSTGAITGVAWLIDPVAFANPLYHVLGGGLLIGAFFMATDMVTSPVSNMGMIIFGVGCGVITAVIRLWGAYPEGVSFAILIMNGLVPIIDKYTKPKKFGDNGRAAA